jgi:hypothetical protein
MGSSFMGSRVHSAWVWKSGRWSVDEWTDEKGEWFNLDDIKAGGGSSTMAIVGVRGGVLAMNGKFGGTKSAS